MPGSRHPYFDEKTSEREARIKRLFESLDCKKRGYLDAEDVLGGFLQLTHLPAHNRYVTDLLAKCDTAHDGVIYFQEFRNYVVEKEKYLWELFSEINRSSDYKLRPKDLESALKAAGIHVTNDDITHFIQCIDTGKLIFMITKTHGRFFRGKWLHRLSRLERLFIGKL